MRKYAYSNLEDIYNDLKTSPHGLHTNQVQTMEHQYGNNRMIDKKSDTIWYRLGRAFLNPFTMILFLLAMVSFLTDIWISSNFSRNATTVIIICTMILISGITRFIQEMRSKKASDQLVQLVNTNVNVIRNGIIIKVPAEKLVVGDYVLLTAGNRIPADLRLTKTSDLFVSQAAITGESAIVEKTNEKQDYGTQTAFSDYKNLVFMGTTIISGTGEGIVLAVGKETLYGNFSKNNMSKSDRFEKGANSIAWVLIRFMVVLIPIVFIVSGFTKGNWFEAFLFSLSVAVGLTPEMLPMVITTCLAKGSISMSKKQTIIKNISAMQGFGSMDVLCLDKTGTLTNQSIDLEYYMDILGNESLKVLDFAYINSFYHSGVKNHIDDAILKFHTMPGKEIYYKNLTKKYQKVDEVPFDFNRKCVSILVTDSNQKQQLILKGNVEDVFSRCSFVEYQGDVLPITEDGRNSVSTVVDEMLEDGMKVIAVARKDLTCQTTVSPPDECGMILMGYLAFFDAPKKSAAQAISKLSALHVKAKILTGDHSSTALSICRRVSIGSQNILTGDKINCLSDWDLQLAVENTDVFAELTPNQKVRIIETLKENGHTVGFLGDGLNDIPAISEADVGISVDTAVDAAKDVADVILLKKDLNVLEEGILEGRKTFINMYKYIKITASSNFGNIFAIVCASAFLPFLPMTAIQILLLNLLYDTLCIVLPWDNVDKEEYSSPQRWSGETLGSFMRFFGPISSVFDILTFVFLYFILCPIFCNGMLYTQLNDISLQARYISLFQTGWFLESMWTQIMIIHMLRTKKIPFLQSSASFCVLFITIAGILLFTNLVFTPMGNVLGLTILPLWYFGFLFIIVMCYMLFTTIIKRVFIRKYHKLI